MSALADYQRNHIPGAIYLDWTQAFLQPDIAVGLAPVADADTAQRHFQALGVCPDDTLVLYDDYHHMLAGRIWWAMRYWGFANVRVLNGGWQYWRDQQYPICTKVPKVTQGHFSVSQQARLRVSTEDVKNRTSEQVLLDARGPFNFRGNPDDPRSGHIPEAVHLPYSELLQEGSGLMKPLAELKQIFAQRELDLSKSSKLIASCGSGYAGTVVLLALEQLGVSAALYDDSFAVWKRDTSLPVEQGEADYA